jgi:hypothetical protein
MLTDVNQGSLEGPQRTACIICFDILETDAADVSLSTTPCCSLKLHKECLDEWFEIGRNCPHCRCRLAKIKPREPTEETPGSSWVDDTMACIFMWMLVIFLIGMILYPIVDFVQHTMKQTPGPTVGPTSSPTLQ